METIALSAAPPRALAPMSNGRVLRAYLEEARAECLRYLRSPSFMLPTLLFPLVFYTMFGVVLGQRGNPDAPRFLLAAYGTFGVMAPGLFGFGMSLALERDNGLLTLKRALPMPPAAYLLGKMAMAMLVAAIIIVLLLALAVFAGHVRLEPAQIARLFVADVLGVLPFCAMGLLLGTLVKGHGAPAVVNLLYLPMAFLSGLWFPLSVLPKFLQQLAPMWPSYHLNALSQSAVGFDTGPGWPHALILLGFTAGFLLLAARRLRRYG
ncbi:ABC transporter permease [Luteimonas gilva]|uniref:Transport permease protein n=1 Tax=Luteimonas gilva TaxID=2572684 RepID=A0A4U5JNZ7_9GAMM|nr:ABC transporter permease [Luteimonas gilva]TKR30526.1 ABC transporter permease [Luteimonas gilva]